MLSNLRHRPTGPTTPGTSQAASARRRITRPSAGDLFHLANVHAPHFETPLDPKRLTKWALGIWRTNIDARLAVPTARYLAASGLVLPDCIDGEFLRFNPRLKYGGDRRCAGLVWLLRDVFDDAPVAILRVYLNDDATLIARRTLGRLYYTAVKLSDDADVTAGLHITPSVESALKPMGSGLRPVWAVIGVDAIEAFPAIPGIEAVTIIDNDGGVMPRPS